MKILLLHAHPDAESFNGALHQLALQQLRANGHEVDNCDLYAERFDPCLSRQERLAYHDESVNLDPVRHYVERLKRAEAIVMCYPVWNFGYPAILKGYFDRVFLPGISFKLVEGRVVPNLQHISKVAVITTYGGPRWRAFVLGDPPRKLVKRVLRVQIRPRAPVYYLAHYDMNRSTPQTRAEFLAAVEKRLRRF